MSQMTVLLMECKPARAILFSYAAMHYLLSWCLFSFNLIRIFVKNDY